MQQDILIRQIETDIDRAFAASELPEAGYAQAAWTLLSVNEDAFIEARRDASGDHDMHVFADVRLNALRHPLRVCLERAERKRTGLRDVMINEHYQLALDWIKSAMDYDQFCAIFPLWHRGRVRLAIDGNRLIVTRSADRKCEYEAYNRLIRQEARLEPDAGSMPDDLGMLLSSATTVKADSFYVRFSPKLVSALTSWLSPLFASRQTLPENWAFYGFTLRDYRTVYSTIQSMLFAGQQVRWDLASSGMPGLGYRSSVLTVSKKEQVARLRRHTELEANVLRKILDLLTLGSNGIQDPDIATQPLIDLKNGLYALSPFVWLSSSVERNLCVLLNKIPEKKSICADLTNEKEAATKREIIAFLSPLNLSFGGGNVKGTNVDLAIIDRPNKACLCLELKWFIGPAEIREVDKRTKDLATGIKQAKIINRLFSHGDERLIRDVLKIGSDYSFLSIIASQNWIGHAEVQDPEGPIIKVWHLLAKIKEYGSLPQVLRWLKDREYLPLEGRDYTIVPMEIFCGSWRAAWYAIRPH